MSEHLIEDSHLLAIHVAQFQMVKAMQTNDVDAIQKAAVRTAAFAALERARREIFNQYNIEDITGEELKTYKYSPRGKNRVTSKKGVNTSNSLTTKDLDGLEPKVFVRVIRESCGMTQEQFAEMWIPPIDKSTVARVELGQRKLTMAQLHAMGRGLQWPEDDDRFKTLKENLVLSQLKP